MKLSIIGALSFLGLALAAPTDLVRSDGPPGPDPNTVYFANVSYIGSGCPANSAMVDFTSDRKAFSLGLTSFTAYLGPAGPDATRQAHTNCKLLLNVHYPAGWQFEIFDASYRGTQYLESDKVKGTLDNTYYFIGATPDQQLHQKHDYWGATNGGVNFADKDTFGVLSYGWSPCGFEGKININSGVTLSTKTPLDVTRLLTTSWMGVEAVDGKFTTVFSLRWQRC